MRDLRKGKILGRKRGARKALMSSLASNLVINSKIKTTEARAKELRRYIEPLITKASAGSLASVRILNSRLNSRAAKTLHDQSKDAKKQGGGYTRITKIGKRKSDAASMVYMEIIKNEE